MGDFTFHFWGILILFLFLSQKDREGIYKCQPSPPKVRAEAPRRKKSTPECKCVELLPLARWLVVMQVSCFQQPGEIKVVD